MDPPAELFRKRGILQLNFVRMHKGLNFVSACCSLAIAFMHDVGYSENIVRGTAIQRCQTPAERAAAAGVGAVAEACFSETAGDVAEELVPVRCLSLRTLESHWQWHLRGAPLRLRVDSVPNMALAEFCIARCP